MTLSSILADITGGPWSLTGAGRIRLAGNGESNPALHLVTGATSRTFTISAGLMDDPDASTPRSFDIYRDSGASGPQVIFSGNNTGFTGGFHLKGTLGGTLIFTTAQALAGNNITLDMSAALRFGTSTLNQTFSGNIAMGDDAAKVSIYASSAAGSTNVISGVISGKGGVEFWTYSGGGLSLTADNTYEGDTMIASGVSLTFDSVSNFGTGNRISFAPSGAASPTLVFAQGNTNDLTKKADGSRREVDLRNATVTFDVGANDVTFANALTSIFPTSGISKRGSGTLRLEGANQQRTATTVEEGTLLINNTTGSGTGTSEVTVQAGATLGGTGTIQPTETRSVVIRAGGTLSPGDAQVESGLGSLSINLSSTSGKLIFEEDARLAFRLGSGLTSSLLEVVSTREGSVVFGESVWIDLLLDVGAPITEGDYLVFSATGGGSVFEGLVLDEDRIIGGLFVDATSLGYAASLRLEGGNIVLSMQAIPEPGTVALLAITTGALLCVRKRRAV